MKNEIINQQQKDFEQNEQQETQLIAVSVPQMETESQIKNAVEGIIEPIKRERTIKNELNKLKVVS